MYKDTIMIHTVYIYIYLYIYIYTLMIDYLYILVGHAYKYNMHRSRSNRLFAKNKFTPTQEATLSSTAFKLVTAVQDGLCFPARPENRSYVYPMDFPPVLG